MERATLFMFPYAGASASVFDKWRPLFRGAVDIVPVELPGRGRRFSETPMTRIQPLAADAVSRLSPRLYAGRYALFGHSLGSVVALEFARQAIRLGHPPPVHLIVSGRAAPQAETSGTPVHSLPDGLFAEKIASLGGTPSAVFRDDNLLSVFMPILRADYEASETYRDDGMSGRIPCGITVLHGTEDGRCDLADWSVHAEGACCLHSFEGGHFFIHEHAASIAELICRTIACC